MTVVGMVPIVAAIAGAILDATNTLGWRDMGSVITVGPGISFV